MSQDDTAAFVGKKLFHPGLCNFQEIKVIEKELFLFEKLLFQITATACEHCTAAGHARKNPFVGAISEEGRAI
jgi:hypothetical protein